MHSKFKPAEIKLLRSFKWRFFFHRHLQNVVSKQALFNTWYRRRSKCNNHKKTALGQNSRVANMSRDIRESTVRTIPLSGTGNIQCTNGYYRTQALTIMLTRKKKKDCPVHFFRYRNHKPASKTLSKLKLLQKARKRPEFESSINP